MLSNGITFFPCNLGRSSEDTADGLEDGVVGEGVFLLHHQELGDGDSDQNLEGLLP